MPPAPPTPPEAGIVILGGGPAGCATALALRRLGLDGIVLVDRGAPGRDRVGESLVPDARAVLDRLGILTDFLAEGHDPCPGSASAWGHAGLGFNDFVFNPYGSGWHLDRRRFDAFLLARTAAAGVTVLAGYAFDRAEPAEADAGTDAGADAATVLVLFGPDGRERRLSARFVVDATGLRGRYAATRGARRQMLDGLTFVAGFFDLKDSANESRLTLLEAVPDGWWYAARLPGDRMVVTFASDPEILRAGGLLDTGPWSRALAATDHVFPAVAAGRPLDDGVQAWAAPSFRLDRAAGPGWLAVGDAAAAFDPLSSQGIHKAMIDGAAAADAIAGWRDGDTGALQAYADGVAERFEEFRRVRRHFYGLERRWPDAPFWRRRQEAA